MRASARLGTATRPPPSRSWPRGAACRGREISARPEGRRGGCVWRSRRAPSGVGWIDPSACQWGGILLASFGIAASAQAGTLYSLVWTGTTGSGITGSSTIEAQPGDVLTLDALMSFDAAGGSGFEFDLIGTNVTAVSGEECPLGSSSGSFPNPIAGTCSTGFSFLTPVSPGVFVQGSDILGYDAFSGSWVGASPVIWVGRGVFVAQGAGQVELWDPPCGGAEICTLELRPPSAVATIVPEPDTAGLLALGVGALALRRRVCERER